MLNINRSDYTCILFLYILSCCYTKKEKKRKEKKIKENKRKEKKRKEKKRKEKKRKKKRKFQFLHNNNDIREQNTGIG